MLKKCKITISLSLLLLLSSITTSGFGQAGNQYLGPIIDMHLHAYTNEDFIGPAPNPSTGEMSADNATEHRRQTIEILKKNNIVLSVVDGESPAALDPWEQMLGDGVIRGLRFENPKEDLELNLFKEWVKEGKIQLFGEVGTTYAGYSPADSILDPYLEVSEEFDIPVGIHTGGSYPGIHINNQDFRLRYGDPFLVEDILVTHPKLRVYLMHSGSHFYERTAMLMVQYPNLYSDIAIMNWYTNAEVFLVPFLKLAKEYQVLDRVMFGTDQMIWPEAIKMAIEKVQSLDFLTLKEKEDIFYMNAARFLNLSDETIAKHHDQK
jgi:predicted TIM-barrel fold metal-dependent hydrolase